MDEYTTEILIVIGFLAAIGILWAVWKFFFGLFKHVLIALLLGAVLSLAYRYYLSSRNVTNPNVGKHVYSKVNGKYLGVVEGENTDAQRGPVWVVRQPGGYPTMYTKTGVTLKERRDPDPSPTAAPSPNPAVSPKAKQNKEKAQPAAPKG